MKCPECNTNRGVRRDGMRCKCGYKFIFDPKGADKMTDGRFMAHQKGERGWPAIFYD